MNCTQSINFKAIKTSGDINQNIRLSEIGGKNLFCKEIEEKLISNEIDIAVHSLKDMESVEDNRLTIGAYIKRNDFRDVIISNKIKNITFFSVLIALKKVLFEFLQS